MENRKSIYEKWVTENDTIRVQVIGRPNNGWY